MEDKNRVYIIIPAYNEENTIEEVVKGCNSVCKANFPLFEIIVFDDGSTDSTKIKVNGATLLTHPICFGKGKTILDAWFWLMNSRDLKPDDIIVHFDSDGQHYPKDIPRIINTLNGVEMAIGKRNLSKYPKYKQFGNKFLSWSASLLAGQKIEDSESGLRAFKASMLLDLYKYVNATGFEIECEMNVVSSRLGYKIGFIEIESTYRHGITLFSGFKNFYYMIKTYLKIRLNWTKIGGKR
jgi:glycosyltransferase involved in cell wall biosynthesis